MRSQARINPRTQMADLSVTFDSGPTFTFGKLDISGTKRYPQKIIENVNPIHEGEIYDIARVNELQRQVQNTPYYAASQSTRATTSRNLSRRRCISR